MLNPLIFWALILNALVIGSLVITEVTYVQVLLATPYNFSKFQVALVKFSAAIGALFAYPASGPLTTWIVRKLTFKNKGIREPEHYLPSFIIPVVACVVSLVVFGAAIQGQWDWSIICLAVGINYFSAISLFTAMTLWVTESFPLWRAPAMVVVSAGGYGWSFALSSGIIPWLAAEGYAKTYIQMAVVVYGVASIGIPIYFFGKKMRGAMNTRWGNSKL